MRSQRVFTNFRCNQNCSFCTYRRPQDDPRAISALAVHAAIDSAIGEGAAEIVLTGGEPTMRRDLDELVAHARKKGAKSVVVETNATLVTPDLATALVNAGTSLVRVHLPLGNDALDQITRDPGGFAAASSGLRSLAAAGLRLEISATLVRSTAAHVSELPAALTALVGDAIERVVVTVPVESANASELLTHREAARALLALDGAARRHAVRVQIAEHSGPPPCSFPARERPHHLYALSRGGAQSVGFRQLTGCASCTVRDRCPGIAEPYLARFPETSVDPIVDDRSRRRLSVIGSVASQIERELVSPSFSGRGPEEALVRVNFSCNQACDFCFVSTHLPTAPTDAVERAIVDAARAGKRVVLSGGEPTLNPRLARYVALTREVSGGAWKVELQTNAVLLDDPTKVRTLVDAGLGAAFVSLHGSRAEIADAITRAPGTFARTVVGIDHLVSAGVDVILNYVLCATNKEDLPAAVELVAARWPRAALNVSFVAPSTDVVPREAWLIPRYAETMPSVERALTLADSLGVRMMGFESMCGIPLCLVPSRIAEFVDKQEIVPGGDQGEFMRADACAGCALSTRCWGVRRGYAEIWGTSELRTVPAADAISVSSHERHDRGA